MKIKSFTEVDEEDKMYVVVLTNKSEHFVPSRIIGNMLASPLGAIVKLPSESFINRSHIVEVNFSTKATSQYIYGDKSLCKKYELVYDNDAPFQYQLSDGYKLV